MRQNGYNGNQQPSKPFTARDVQEIVAILRSRPNGAAELSHFAPQWDAASLREMATSRPDILRIQDMYIVLHGAEVEKKPVADLFEAWHEFRPESTTHGELPLAVGELVSVTEQHAKWWKGIKVKSTGRGGPGPGWFPAAMVEPLCGTMKPTGAGGRLAFFEIAASRILKFDPKNSRMDVDLAGLHPELSDDDLVAFSHWLSPRLQSQRDRAQISLDVSRNAIGANGLRAFLEMIASLNIGAVAIDVSSNPLGDGGIEPICTYVERTARQTVKSVNVTGTSLQPQGAILKLMKALTLRPVMGHNVAHLTAPEDGASERLQYIEQEFGVKLMVEEAVIGNGPWSP
jgi:hypothetical protein